MTTIRFYNYEEDKGKQWRENAATPTLTQIGEKYGKTAAQVALRWLLQSDVIIIPKTVHKERMQENLNLFDFELDAEDMQKIAALDTAQSLFLDHHSGETTKQFMEWRAVVKPTE
ncbi:aldo/keto reductase [Segatella hominis]|uniref:aldo/keto reductase n=1 Tax=Segatella hominis TaxID=2518605 RepID=UPI003AAA8ED5